MAFITLQGEEIYKNNVRGTYPSPSNSMDLTSEADNDDDDAQSMDNGLGLDLSQLDQAQHMTNAKDQAKPKIGLKATNSLPKMADGLETGFREARHLEQNFRESALKLQKKIGIPNSGFVFF